MSGIFLPQRSLRQKPLTGAPFNANCSLLRGLQCLYAFNEGGGTSFLEASGRHPAASLVYGGSGQPWTKGFGGPAVNLTSAIGYVNAGNICDNQSTFTVSCWFRTSSTFSLATMIGKMGSGGLSTGQGWSVIWASGAPGTLTQLSGGSTYSQINTNSSYNDGKWHHGVFTVSGYAVQKVYIDAVQQAVTSYGSGTVTTTTNSSNLEFGADNGTGDVWNGSLDMVAIWNRVLGVDEIDRLYVDPFYLIAAGGQNYFSKARIVKKPVGSLSAAADGIASLEAFGAEGIANSLTPLGIVSQAVHGAQGVAENILPLGVMPQEILGAANTAINNASNLFPGGTVSSEAEGATLFKEGIGPSGIVSGEAEGKPSIGLNLDILGITSGELFGALKSALANRDPINIPLRRRSAFSKPSVGTVVNTSHSLTQGLAAAWVMNEGGGTFVRELLSGAKNNIGGTIAPTWGTGMFGSAILFPGGASAGRIAVPEMPSIINIGLDGGMSVSFWFKTTSYSAMATIGGCSVMGKNDSTDGGNATGSNHGWVINLDNWHDANNSNYNNVAFPPPGSPNLENTGNLALKLEFENASYNKQGGVYIPNDNALHHIVITTAGGASAPATDDYSIYLDGQPVTAFLSGGTIGGKYFCTGWDYPGLNGGTGANSDMGSTQSDAGYSMAIGSHPNGTNPFGGVLDNVLVYNRCLSSAEAQLLYTDPFCFMYKPRRRMRATHSTASLSITPLGIVSAEKLGALTTTTALGVSPLAIVSGERIGALQAAIASIQDLYPGGIITLESPGADTVIVAVPIGTPSNRILSPSQQYRIFNLKIEERTL